MKISVVMPVFNEVQTITEILQRVAATEEDKEIIVVDDGSTDGTRDILQSMDNIVLIFHEYNCGKGAAIRTALEHVTGDVVIIQDADLEYDPQDYPTLLTPIIDGDADVVYGSRFLGGPHRVLFFWHYVANRLLTLLSNIFTNTNLTDMEVGYKVFRAEALQGIHLQSDRFGFEPEITAKIAHRGLRLYEVPISYRGRDYTAGKKITWRDGIAALYFICTYNLLRGPGEKKTVPHRIVQQPNPAGLHRVAHSSPRGGV